MENKIEQKLCENSISIEDKIERKLYENAELIKENIADRLKFLEEKMNRMNCQDKETVSVVEQIMQIPPNDEDVRVRMKIVPPTFDGKVTWPTEERATSLIVDLRGKALNVLQTVPDSQQNGYELLTSRLEMRYEDAYSQEVYRLQKSTESLQEFESHIVRLARLAYPTALSSFFGQLGIETFMDGFRDSETQRTLARPRTLDDANVA
ncbi:hypothetical protein FQR65_LT13660 [Abscondita terminalis]|nr:hypothetical protein FQR65_LT13660 [Abscondita terminalis]